jgi:hypothetical protein
MQNGTNMTAMLIQITGAQMPMIQQQSGKVTTTNPLGKAVQTSQNNTATKSQEKAASVAMPR